MSLATKLQKELTRNPKKTGALGLMCVVAVWFWVPLFLGKDKDKEKISQQAAVKAKAVKASVVASPTPTPSSPTSLPAMLAELPINWEDLAGQIARDQLMKSGDLATGVRDPFRLSEQQRELLTTVEKPDETLVDELEKKIEDKTPAQLGITLGGTVLGSRRVATLNGRAYAEGAVIAVAEDDEEEEIAFVVSKVEANYVVLERNSRLYTVKLDAKRKRNDMIVRN